MHLLGRTEGAGPTATIGTYRAPDGTDGATVRLDVDRPHAALIVGKRGYGKSYTLGVLAEELAGTPGVAPVVVDPMGVFDGLADGDFPARVVDRPRVPAAIEPPAWPELFDLPPESAVGSLLWRAAAESDTLAAMREFVEESSARTATRRGAANRLDLAAGWDVFAPDGVDAATLDREGVTVLDCSGLDDAPRSALVRAVATSLYDARVRDATDRLPWLLVDEAHVPFDGVAAPALRTLLTRGRQPGVSLVAATQRPGALPGVAVSQSDLLIAHRLTARADLAALEAARPSYAEASVAERMPARPGEAIVVDDVTERVHSITVRRRTTPHGGASPRASRL